ncbi:MAG: V-type ATPase subunit [Sphaerochaetaceae bacterium]
MSSPVKRYGFINAKLRARIGSMISDEKAEMLLRSGSLEEFLQQLKDTPYAMLSEEYDKTGDIQHLESLLFAREVELHKEVIHYFDGDHAALVMALTAKLEIENLKAVLRLFFSNTVKRQNIDFRFGYLYQGPIVSKIDWTQIANANNFQEVLSALQGTPCYETISGFDPESFEQEGLFYLETAIDTCWFKHLRQAVLKMPKQDRRLLTSVLDTDADLKNIINLVRFGWAYRLPSDRLRSIMFDGGSIRQFKEFEEFLKAEAEQRSPLALIRRRFPKFASQLTQRQLDSTSNEHLIFEVEHHLGSLRKNEYRKMLRGDPFTIGTVLAYFFLCGRQDAMIRSMLNGLYYGWSSEAIREYAL